MEFIFGIIVFIAAAILIITISDWFIIGFVMPAKKKKYEKEYLLTTGNRMDYQKSSECSGFSSAYVLRSFGIEAEGNDIYAKMPGKLKNGAVLPKNLKKVLQQYGFKVTYIKGNLESLKAELSTGKRVIVLIKTRVDKNWLHYVPIVGYDDEYIYIAESMHSLVNCEDTFYNRKVSNYEFLKLWDTRAVYMPFYKNTYLVIRSTPHGY